ncbi:MAG: Na/Pi cotransporter family protein [Phyllobacteriaceae bacterium]|nr:Na/Pi cotransporter family protein [Phyllobacteriaceae bacterium]
MTGTILAAFGGIGLILLGMTIMTEGLRALAGDSLRRVLSRFTRNAFTGALTGAAITAAMQSSTAVTVTTVGLVGGGVLTFLQALGVIFGANVGTTVTGWLVAVLGFKFDLQTAMLPAVFAGALLRRYGRGKLAQAGFALAGFGLLFMGLGTLKDGLAGLEGLVTPDSLPDDGWTGRAMLMAIGAAMTVITQSSSAGVAAALVALHGGTIALPQAAALVIGMDVGTTASAALATLGGSTAMRRTGYAHVVLNLMTGIAAYLALDPLLDLARWISGDGGALALVAFHTGFNVAGVLLLLPFAGHFARLIERLVPERGPPLTVALDERLLSEPASAVDAAMMALKRIAMAQAELLADYLDRGAPVPGRGLYAPVGAALEAARLYIDRIGASGQDGRIHARHRAAMHALDHMLRLHNRLGQGPRIAALDEDAKLRRMASMLAAMARRAVDTDVFAPHAARLGRLRALYLSKRDAFRATTIEAAAHDLIATDAAILRLDAMRWLDRVAYHLWRIAVNFGEGPGASAPDPEDDGEA